MVRLLHTPSLQRKILDIVFQSHNGAIAANNSETYAVYPTAFQSHNGAIAADERLKGLLEPLQFQSHNGAIAAVGC